MRTWLKCEHFLIGAIAAGVAAPASGTAAPSGGPGRDAAGRIVVNEFFYRGGDTELEFVELFNGSARTIDLSTIRLSDSRRKAVAVSDISVLLAPGGFAVLVRKAAAFDARFSFPDRMEVKSWPALNNSGDTIILWSGDAVLDSVRYSGSWGMDDVSLERLDPSGPSQSRTNWAPSIARSGGTPGRINSVFAPDFSPPRPIFCEEIGPGRLAVYFSEPLDPSSVSSSSFNFEDGSIPYESEVHESGNAVFLSVPGDLKSNMITVTGVSDLSGNAAEDRRIDVAYLPRYRELVLNEIMYEPLADDFDHRPNQPEYVEILSTTSHTIAIGSLVLTDRLREDGTRDTTSLTERRLAVAPGSIALAYAGPDPTKDPLEAFPDIDRSDPGLVLLPVERSSLSLGNNGDTIRLEGASGLVDEVEYAPSWHLPERVETRGTSLERISAQAPSQDPSNWSTSVDASGGTPGRVNSIRASPRTNQTGTFMTTEPDPFSPDGDGFEDFATITLTLPRPTAVARVWIFDLDGRLVRELHPGRPIGPTSTFVWDGRGENGSLLRTGIYVLLVEAVDVGSGFVSRSKAPIALVRR